MLYSMTAFARSESKAKNLHMVWEIKSVNHRFLETYFRVPEGLRAIETKIRDVTRKKIKRGKIDGFLKLEHQANQSSIKLNHNILEQLLVSIENVKAKFGTADVSAIEILRWPGLIEDQISQKRCGHLENKELITTKKMVKKIKECVNARKDKNFKIIARSDARNVEGLEKMIERCKSYIDAGAEIIFPEALKDEKEFEIVRKKLNSFLLANMTEFGKTKLLNFKKLENLGYNIVIYPVTTQRLAMKNVEDGLRAIFQDGHQNNIIDKMQTRKRLYDLVDYEKYNALDEKIYNFSTEGHE